MSEGILQIQKSIRACDKDGPLLVFVTKMQPYHSKLYDATIRSTEPSEFSTRLIAVARVLSGTIRQGSSVFIIGPTHTVEKPDVTETTIDYLFLMMG